MIHNGVADILKLQEIFRSLHLTLLQTLGIESLYHKFLVLYNSVILIWEPQIMETGGALGQKKATTHNILVRNRECNTQRGLIDSLYITLGSLGTQPV